MLFNSSAYIFLFLPVTLMLFFLLGRRRQRAASYLLMLASLVFYGIWNPLYVLLLLASIAANFLIGRLIICARSQSQESRGSSWLVLGIVGNLALLAWFKYFGFATAVLHALVDWPGNVWKITLPLGISFFTFTQIAYLVDASRGRVQDNDPVRYALFV